MKLLCLVPLAILLVAAGPPRAGAAAFTLESAVPHALRHNADLAAARLRIEEARGRWQHAGRLASPELELAVVPPVASRESAVSAGLTQKFPVTARLRLEKAVSHARLAEAEAEVQEAERQLALEIRSRMARWLALATLRQLREEQQANSRELAALARTNSVKGEGSASDALQLELEAGQLALQGAQLDAAQAALTEELRPLLGMPDAEPLEITGGLPEPVLSAPADALPQNRPDYRLALARLQAANRGVELARTHRWEDIGIGVFGEARRRDDAPLGLINENLVGVRFTMPLPFGGGRSGVLHEATSAAARAEREAEALARRIQSEIATARRNLETAARRASEIAEGLLPKVRELEALSARLHSQGQSPWSDVLRAREKRHALEADRLEALRDFHLAHVHYLAAVGDRPTAVSNTTNGNPR
jgi:cobalt-zinc-cadmium efflux system outer membrane protein